MSTERAVDLVACEGLEFAFGSLYLLLCAGPIINVDLRKGEAFTIMRERDREIKRRRQRYQKRKKLRLKLATAGAEADQQKIEAKIRKTYPTFTLI